MEKLTFKEWSILSDLQTIAPLGEDFEFSMARGELKTERPYLGAKDENSWSYILPGKIR